MVPIISVVGPGKSGKTSLIKKLIGELKEKGYRVAAIKHDPEDHGEVDKKGSDTDVFFAAGSPSVALSSPSRLSVFRRVKKEMVPEEIAPLLGDIDCVILEGYKSRAYPKIAVWARSKENLIIKNKEELLAVVCDADEKDRVLSILGNDTRIFSRDDIKNIVFFLEREILIK